MERQGGINKLAQALQGRMNQVMNGNKDTVCDLGTIQSDMSLLTDLFPIPIPRGSYLVCRQLTIGDKDEEFAETNEKGIDNHKHKVKLPESMRKLKPGDRVLVCWVQNDAVVVDIVGI